MNIKKLVGIILVIGLLIIALAAIGNSKNVGGTFNPVPVEFSKGITVGGTEIINSAGTFIGGIATSIASTIGSVGAGAAVTVPVLTPTADTTLTLAQSGSTVNMGTAGVDVTLPTPASSAGVSYKFVVSANFATTDMTIVSGTADKIEGSMIVAGAVVDCDASDLITFVADGENIGDFIEIFSNGTNWLVGQSGALTASKMTCSG